MTERDVQTPDRHDDALDIAVCTARRTRRLARAVSRIHDVHLEATGLTTEKYALLALVSRHQPATSTTLARLADIDPSTLSRNLQPLLHAGWIAKYEGPDRRCHSLRLTPAGVEKFAAASDCWATAQGEVERKLGARQLAELHRLLDASADALLHDRSRHVPD